jgi:zinc D-Ala-D-Ala carboxypeptidase
VRNTFIAVAVVATVAACGDGARGECVDTVRIDSVSYTVGAPWCGHRLDSSLIATPATLVLLPDSLTYNTYRIYVTRETERAFIAMAAAARRDSVRLVTDSGFRSPGFQRRLIAKRLAEGKSFATITRSVAPPGYSQHHTGRALDLVPSNSTFAETKTYAWLKENAAAFGFVESYPRKNDEGRHWESWHWYYIGEESR